MIADVSKTHKPQARAFPFSKRCLHTTVASGASGPRSGLLPKRSTHALGLEALQRTTTEFGNNLLFAQPCVLLLTGAPLQNNVEELWVLLNFLDSKKFASKEDFLDSFGELTDSAQVERLHSELKPYLLRRMKKDVEKSLAPKEETIIEVELTVLQKQYYRAIYEKNTEFLSRGGRKGDTPSLMNVLMELRKCCNHPFLVKGVEEREVKRLTKQPNVPKNEIQQQISERLVDTSGKLVLLDKLMQSEKETITWRNIAMEQFQARREAELHNAQLRDNLLARFNCRTE